jgi:putative chitinase
VYLRCAALGLSRDGPSTQEDRIVRSHQMHTGAIPRAPADIAGLRALIARLRHRAMYARTPAERAAWKRALRRARARLSAASRPQIGWRSVRYVCPTLSATEARRIAAGLGAAFARYDITTRARAAAAVAQMAHESDGFMTSTEYADGRAYEGRRDLGNVRPGDGRRYRGRGRIMITGRANYSAVSKALGQDFVSHPERLAQSPNSELASCWWWATHGCNALADRGDFVALTRRINGGTNGLDDRLRRLRRARRVARWLVPRP